MLSAHRPPSLGGLCSNPKLDTIRIFTSVTVKVRTEVKVRIKVENSVKVTVRGLGLILIKPSSLK